MQEAPGMHDPTVLPPDIPAPQDDGGARHLTGMKLPDLALMATDGAAVVPLAARPCVRRPAAARSVARSRGGAAPPRRAGSRASILSQSSPLRHHDHCAGALLCSRPRPWLPDN